MAVLNKEEGYVVLRIVYAGAPLSGKTESLRALSELLFGARRCEEEFFSPDDTSGRTLYFDWLNYTGGYFRGYKVNCQLISVPGQQTLKNRRRLLLEMADVVVFVVDSESGKLDAALDYYREMLPWLQRRDEPPVGVVIQANKRDTENAAPMALIYDSFGNDPNLLALETIATKSSGIRETFVAGVRIGLERASWLLDNQKMEIGASDLDSGQALLDVIRKREGLERMHLAQQPGAAGISQRPARQVADVDLSPGQLHRFICDELNARHSAEPKPEPVRLNSGREEPAAGIAARPDSAIPAPKADSGASSTLDNHAGTRGSNLSGVRPGVVQPGLPDKDVIAGSVFPPISGRIILHKIANEEITVEQTAEGAWEASIGHQWRLLSRAEDSFASSNEARMHLVRYANTHKKLGALLSEHRCMAIVESDDHDEWRVWQIVRNEASLDELLNHALKDTAPQRIAEKVYIIAEKFVDAHKLFAGSGVALPAAIGSIGLQRNKPVFTGYLSHQAVDQEDGLAVLDLLKRNFKPPISTALRENPALTLGVPYILHPLDVYARGKPENRAMVDVLRTLFIGEH